MGKHSPARSFATAVSALALVLGLAACAGGPGASPSAATDPSSAMLLKVADETAAGGDPATAASLYRRAHDLSPKDPVPLARLGAMLLALQEPGAAAQAYRAAVALSPTNSELHRGLALALLASNQPEAAATEIRAALEKRAGDARLYSLLGVAHDMGGHHDLAQESYRKGLELAPASIGLRNNMAMSLALAGDYGGAVARLTEIVGPEAPPRYRLNLAMAYALAGDDDKAAATARQVLDEQSVRNNLAYYTLLRGMDDKRRTAAILGAELHGGAISPSEVAAAQAALATTQNDAPVAAPPPPSAVSVADLPPIQAPAAPVPLTRSEPPQAKAAAEAKPASFRVALAQPERPLAVKQRTTQIEPAVPAAADPSPPTGASQVALPEDMPPEPPAAPTLAESKTEFGSAATPAPEAHAPQDPPPVIAATHEAAPPAAEAPQAAAEPAKEPATARAAPAEQTIAKADPPPPQAASEPLAAETATAKPDAAPQTVAKAEPPKPPHAARTTVDRFVVQLGSWLTEATAHKIADQFAAKGVAVAVSRFNDHDGRTWFVVRSGDFASADEANTLRQSIQSVATGGISPLVVRVRTSQPSASPAA